ncbi:MAG: thiamine-phosphate kinase [Rhodospirillaceae bacterium]|nr:MAG: thiamine-phosphate kinase [Rhodospirillaceae bacterium]
MSQGSGIGSGIGSEFDLIDRYFKPLACKDAGALNLGDDAALLDIPSGQHLVVTSDALVSGVHFLDSQSPKDIAHKVVGVNLSDLAAMGAKPRAVFLAAQFPKDIQENWIAEFALGLGQALEETGAVLMGGDTVSTPGPMAFTLTALGMVKTGQALQRNGAKSGDVLFVSGTIGDAALGLLCATGKLEENAFLLNRYARPQPRLALGQALAEGGFATACIDVSDGLLADVGHLAAMSGLGLTLRADSVPLSDPGKANLEFLEVILCGGDDYELAFSVPPNNVSKIKALSAKLDLALTQIGVFNDNVPGVRVVDGAGQVIKFATDGFKHF